MEYKEITKVDNGRLFLEIPSKFIKKYNVKRGNSFVLIKKENITSNMLLKNYIGAYVKFFIIDNDDNFIEEIEGFIEKNDLKYNPKEESIKFKFVLINPYINDVKNQVENQILLEFDELENIGNFEILEKEKLDFKTTNCSNKRCRRLIPSSYKYCPHCRTKNKEYVTN